MHHVFWRPGAVCNNGARDGTGLLNRGGGGRGTEDSIGSAFLAFGAGSAARMERSGEGLPRVHDLRPESLAHQRWPHVPPARPGLWLQLLFLLLLQNVDQFGDTGS